MHKLSRGKTVLIYATAKRGTHWRYVTYMCITIYVAHILDKRVYSL